MKMERQSGALKSFKLFHISTNKLIQIMLIPFVQIRQPTFQLPLGSFIQCWLDLLSSFCWILSCHILIDKHQQFWHSINFNPYNKAHFYGFIYAQVMFFQQFYDVADHHGFVFKPTTVKIGNVAWSSKKGPHSQFTVPPSKHSSKWKLHSLLTANKLQMQAKKSTTKFLSNPSSLHVGQSTNCISLLQEQKMYESMASFMKWPNSSVKKMLHC